MPKYRISVEGRHDPHSVFCVKIAVRTFMQIQRIDHTPIIMYPKNGYMDLEFPDSEVDKLTKYISDRTRGSITVSMKQL